MRRVLWAILLVLGLWASQAHATITTTSYSTTVQGNSATTVFTFSFIAGTASNLSVTYTDSTGAQTVLSTSVYTLSLNAAVSPNLWGVGGSVTYNPSGIPIATGTSLTITRLVPYTQQTSITNQSFYPQAIEKALDQVVMQTQQLAGANSAIGTAQAPNLFLGGPTSGSNALAIFRRIAAIDLPGGTSSQFTVADYHYVTGSSAPALTSCGTSPAIVGSDTAGEVTMGTGSPTGCVITFHVAYTSAPYCVVAWRATPLASQSYAISTAAITLTQTGTSSNKIDYLCFARSGG